MENKEETPRRACMWKWTAAEKSINDSIAIIEEMGADTLLSEAQCLLQEAQRKVADYIDNVLPTKEKNPFNPSINSYLEDVKLKGSPKMPSDKYFDSMLKTGSF